MSRENGCVRDGPGNGGTMRGERKREFGAVDRGFEFERLTQARSEAGRGSRRCRRRRRGRRKRLQQRSRRHRPNFTMPRSFGRGCGRPRPLLDCTDEQLGLLSRWNDRFIYRLEMYTECLFRRRLEGML